MHINIWSFWLLLPALVNIKISLPKLSELGALVPEYVTEWHIACIVKRLKLQYVLYNNGVVINLLFYNCASLKADISSNGNECTHCAGNVEQVSSEPFLKGRGETDSVLLGGTVQVIHPAHISSVLVQLRYIWGSRWQKLNSDDFIIQCRHRQKPPVTVSIVKVSISSFSSPSRSAVLCIYTH